MCHNGAGGCTSPAPKGEVVRIISQHRDRSVNFDNVEICIEDTQIYAIGNRTTLLGNYGTEERALEVFEEIHGIYKNDFIYSEYIRDRNGHTELISASKNPRNIRTPEKILVYFMPIS